MASRKTQSLVDVQPSTEMALNESAMASASTCCSTAGLTSASVVSWASVVAMSGRIMPAPLAIPPTRASVPPIVTAVSDSLAKASVVRIALCGLVAGIITERSCGARRWQR